MPTFPSLKTGAIAQYPAATRTLFGPTRSVDFLDGSSQRYCTGPLPLREWTVQLDRLDTAELAVIRSFLSQNQDSVFSFTDPRTGETVPRCKVRGLRFSETLSGEADGGISAVIEERP